jgi:hypothetical protein
VLNLLVALAGTKTDVGHYCFDCFEAVRRVYCLADLGDMQTAIPMHRSNLMAWADHLRTKVMVHENAVDTLAASKRVMRAFWMLQREKRNEKLVKIASVLFCIHAADLLIQLHPDR